VAVYKIVRVWFFSQSQILVRFQIVVDTLLSLTVLVTETRTWHKAISELPLTVIETVKCPQKASQLHSSAFIATLTTVVRVATHQPNTKRTRTTPCFYSFVVTRTLNVIIVGVPVIKNEFCLCCETIYKHVICTTYNSKH